MCTVLKELSFVCSKYRGFDLYFKFFPPVLNSEKMSFALRKQNRLPGREEKSNSVSGMTSLIYKVIIVSKKFHGVMRQAEKATIVRILVQNSFKRKT